jgi:uncharacterized protein (DUF2267 family)
MHASGLEAFDTTLNKTHVWLKEIMDELEWQDRHWSYLALRGVLHSLRDRLPVDEVAQLGAQLPMLIRGMYYEGWKPAGKPLRERHREEFLMDAMSGFGEAALANILSHHCTDAEAIVRAVFSAISRHTTESAAIRHTLPAEIRSLWPHEAA